MNQAHIADPERHDGYEPDLFATIAELEATSWWFRSRNRLIRRTIRRQFPRARSALEIGCGTGYTVAAIASALPRAEIVATELYPDALALARHRLPDVTLQRIDAREMDYENRFDLAAAFDVLEHIDDDAAVLRNLYRALRPGGGLIVTVPQHPWLWSAADTYAHHERRYRRRGLVDSVDSAGFTVTGTTSFVTFVAPVMFLSRARQKLGIPFDPLAEFRIPRALDRAFERVAWAEQGLIDRGRSLPFGGSLLLTARRT